VPLPAGWLAGWYFRPLLAETSTYSAKTNNINFKKRFVAYQINYTEDPKSSQRSC